MHAQKFQIRYSPVQDRVLIIVTGEDGQERMFGMTRRLVKRLVPGLRNIMGADVFATLSPNDPQPHPRTQAQTHAGGRSGCTNGKVSRVAARPRHRVGNRARSLHRRRTPPIW